MKDLKNDLSVFLSRLNAVVNIVRFYAYGGAIMTISSEGWFGLKEITIIPVGDVDLKILNDITKSLEKILKIKAELGRVMPIPKDSFNSKRNQYHSTEILNMLKTIHPYHLGPILGVADVDLYTLDFDVVFGEADPISEVGIISLIRLRQEFYGLKRDRKLFHTRVLKEALHELGHIYGLGHCHNPTCAMHFSSSLKDIDMKKVGFCESCKTKIESRI